MRQDCSAARTSRSATPTCGGALGAEPIVPATSLR